jgi:hypothetical protein
MANRAVKYHRRNHSKAAGDVEKKRSSATHHGVEVKSKTPILSCVERIENAPGWRVINKFEACAAFYIPFEDGRGWNSTAGTDAGGKVSPRFRSTRSTDASSNPISSLVSRFHEQQPGTYPSP